MKIEHEPNMPGLRREWLGARLIGGLAAAVLVAAGGLMAASFWSGTHPEPAARTHDPAPPIAPWSDVVVAPPVSPAEARRRENIALCTAAVGAAQNLGIVPGFATLASDATQNTNVQGRYICLAKTDAARYAVDFDLTCTNLSTGHCISVYTVSMAGSGILYQRK